MSLYGYITARTARSPAIRYLPILCRRQYSTPFEGTPEASHSIDQTFRYVRLRNPSSSSNTPEPLTVEVNNQVESVHSSRKTISNWKLGLLRGFIKVFNVNVERTQAAPIAGKLYYGMCKAQGLFHQNQQQNLSQTAKFYYETMGLPMTFTQWFQITALHVWMLLVRMRTLPKDYSAEYEQILIDALFTDMEFRLALEINVCLFVTLGNALMLNMNI